MYLLLIYKNNFQLSLFILNYRMLNLQNTFKQTKFTVNYLAGNTNKRYLFLIMLRLINFHLKSFLIHYFL